MWLEYLLSGGVFMGIFAVGLQYKGREESIMGRESRSSVG